MGAGELNPKHGHYLGPWGNFGSQTQKGIITYAISSNRQKPFAGATRTAVFNTFRRSKAQFLYVVPPFAGAYLLMNWAIEKNEFYNSKEGRMKAPEESDDATQGGPNSHTPTALRRTNSFVSPTLAMAKEKPAADAEEKRLKKEKKEQKKRSETDGVRKPSSTKKEKSDKKAKKHKDPSSKTKTDKGETRNGEANGGGEIKKEEEDAAAADADDMMMTTQLLNTLEAEKPGSVVVKEQDGDVDVKVKTVLRGALVPFANPLADEKVGKKVLKGVKRAAKHKTLKRGVKEVGKALRKSPPSTSSSASSSALPPAIVILAADISPMDVISHLPVLCEDHAVP
ncbi:MAG: hypothetical protein Q9206_002595, partial [Seirophora lacunosa]